MRIGVDIGGTHILALLMEGSGDTVTKRCATEVFAEQRKDQDYIIELIMSSIVEVLPDQIEMLDGIGFAVPGNVDPVKGSIRYLPNFGWLKEVELKNLVLHGLPEALREVQVEIRNDGRCAALAEYRFGVGKERKDSVFSMLTLGTGIGGAVIIDGKLFDGSTFDAGDFGHHVIASGDMAFDCVCGKKGCFETHASAAGLVRHYNRSSLGKSDTQKEKPKVSLDDARSVMMALRAGESAAVTAFASWKQDLAHGLANLITFYNPSCIVLGGGIGKAGEVFQAPAPILAQEEGEEGHSVTLQQLVDSLTLPATRGKCEIMSSLLGDDAGAIGAAQLIK